MNPSEFLDDVVTGMKAEFDANRRVMSFDEYLELFGQNPRSQVRTASAYFLDAYQYFGEARHPSPLGERRHWSLFDATWQGGEGRLIGQQEAQEAVFRIIQNFDRQRRVNKLVLLHGPNGSAKSSLLGCIAGALEHYSRSDDGALYTFSWVFPRRAATRSRLGFGGARGAGEADGGSYARLEDEDVAARIPGDLRDHPLLLLPVAQRRRLIEEALGDEAAARHVADGLTQGELSPRNQQIAELLFAAAGGDLREVLRHVQVQRFYISRRFRRAVVTVEPQLHVDASVRQLTGDRSLTTLPPVLQSTTLYEPFGDLVDAHRGMIEYNDLLKRPVDSFKYLLSTCEKSSAALPNQILFLDLLFFASSNEAHLAAFREYPDWPSFKGRIELVCVPYIRDYRVETQIYEAQITPEVVQRHIAPHTAYVTALWAVLTRLRKPHPDRYPRELRGTIAALTPMQKAELYATGRAPNGLPLEKVRRLRRLAPEMAHEWRGQADYEGRTGASPRVMKSVMLAAAQRADHDALGPLAVLAEIEALCTQTSVYGFLRQEPEGQFGDHKALIKVVKDRWLELCDDELTHAMGLVTRGQYDVLFRRYLTQVSHARRGERLLNPITGAFDEPDAGFMAEMEKHFEVDKDAAVFRSNLLGRIGAASQPGLDESPDYRELFPELFDKLEGAYYEAQRPTIRTIAEDTLVLINGEGDRLAAHDRERASKTLAALQAEFGYEPVSAQEAIVTLLAERYSG